MAASQVRAKLCRRLYKNLAKRVHPDLVAPAHRVGNTTSLQSLAQCIENGSVLSESLLFRDTAGARVTLRQQVQARFAQHMDLASAAPFS